MQRNNVRFLPGTATYHVATVTYNYMCTRYTYAHHVPHAEHVEGCLIGQNSEVRSRWYQGF